MANLIIDSRAFWQCESCRTLYRERKEAKKCCKDLHCTQCNVLIKKKAETTMEIKFSDLKVGQFFKYYGNQYLKISYIAKPDNAFSFFKNELTVFGRDTIVELTKGEE